VASDAPRSVGEGWRSTTQAANAPVAMFVPARMSQQHRGTAPPLVRWGTAIGRSLSDWPCSPVVKYSSVAAEAWKAYRSRTSRSTVNKSDFVGSQRNLLDVSAR